MATARPAVHITRVSKAQQKLSAYSVLQQEAQSVRGDWMPLKTSVGLVDGRVYVEILGSKHCGAMLQWAWPFAKPVNTEQYKTYLTVIKQPMDLGTVKSKMDKYTHALQFRADVQLVFENAAKFNPTGSDVCLMALGVKVSTCRKHVLCCAAVLADACFEHAMECLNICNL